MWATWGYWPQSLCLPGRTFIFQIAFGSREPFQSTLCPRTYLLPSLLSIPPSIHHGHCEDAPLFYPPSEGPPLVTDPQRPLCPFACARRNTFHAETVRLPFALIFNIPHFSSGRVIISFLLFCHRLIYMHNIKVPLFPRYDMPEKHDLARK